MSGSPDASVSSTRKEVDQRLPRDLQNVHLPPRRLDLLDQRQATGDGSVVRDHGHQEQAQVQVERCFHLEWNLNQTFSNYSLRLNSRSYELQHLASNLQDSIHTNTSTCSFLTISTNQIDRNLSRCASASSALPTVIHPSARVD